jgi:WD40 repeat protein
MPVALLAAIVGSAAAQEPPVGALVPGRPIGSGDISQLSYSPDGLRLGVLTTVGFQIWDTKTGRLLNSAVDQPRAKQFDRHRGDLSWSPDGKRIARAADGIQIWDPMGSAPEQTLPAQAVDGHLWELAWSPGGRHIAAHSNIGVVVFEPESGRRIEMRGPPKGRYGDEWSVGGVSWAPGGNQVAVVAGNVDFEVIDIWEVRTAALVRRIHVGRKKDARRAPSPNALSVVSIEPDESQVEWSPDGRALALSSGYLGVSLWSPRNGALIKRLVSKGPVISISWSRDSRLLHVGGNKWVRFLRPETGVEVYAVESGRYMRCNSVEASGRQVAASYDTGEIYLWRGRENLPDLRIATGAIAIWLKTLSPDSRWLVSLHSEEQAALWELTEGRKFADFQAGVWSGYVWSPDSKMLAVVGPRELRVLQVSDGRVVRTVALPVLTTQLDSFNSASWSPDGRKVLATGARSPALIYLETGVVRQVPQGDGMLLWNENSDLVERPIPRGRGFVQSPDSRRVAVGQEHRLEIWDSQEARVLASIGLPSGVSPPPLAWSPDMRRVAYIAEPGQVDSGVRVVDIATGRVVERWTAGPFRDLRWLVWRDKLAVAESMAGAVRFWRVP